MRALAIVNNLFIGYPLFDTGNFGRPPGTMVPVEDGAALADINDHYGGNYLREASLLAYARSYGYNTAAIGKTGPAAAQDLAEVSPLRGVLRDPVTAIIEGATGTSGAMPLSPATLAMITSAGLTPAPPPRDQSGGTNTVPGTRTPNVAHQQWFADVDPGHPAGVRGECRAVRAGVLVGGPRPYAARAG